MSSPAPALAQCNPLRFIPCYCNPSLFLGCLSLTSLKANTVFRDFLESKFRDIFSFCALTHPAPISHPSNQELQQKKPYWPLLQPVAATTASGNSSKPMSRSLSTRSAVSSGDAKLDHSDKLAVSGTCQCVPGP